MPDWSTRPRDLSQKGQRGCLKCSKPFLSADRMRIRICDKCKQGSAWQGSQESDCLLPPQDSNHMRMPKNNPPGEANPIKSRPLLRQVKRKRKKKRNKNMIRTVSLLFIAILVGCANTTPRQSPEEWLNQISEERISSVVSSCDGTHQNFVTGKSPVDCSTNYPFDLTMSFPDRQLYLDHEAGVGAFFSMWCTSVANRTGDLPGIQLEIREERKLFGVPCERLLTRMQENADRAQNVQ